MNAPVANPSPWAWYQKALKEPKLIGSADCPVHDGDPHIGYYRMKRGRGQMGWIPVAIYAGDDGALVAAVGLWSDGNRKPAEDVWTWCCRYPIKHDIWKAVADRGEDWPDSIASLIKGEPTPKQEEPAPVATVGHNSGLDQADVYASLKEKIEEMAGKALAEADKIGPVTPEAWLDELAVKKDRLANWSNEISKVKDEIEEAFTVEKRPHLEASRKVDEKWRDLKAKGPDTVKKLKAKITDLINAEKAYRLAEAAKIAEAARVASPELDEPPAVVEPIKVTAGTSGRKISMVTKYEAVVTDPVAFATYVLGKDHVRNVVLEALQKVADQYAKLVCLGDVTDVPGIKASSKEVAR